MTTTKKKTGTTGTKASATTRALRESLEESESRYSHLQQRLGGLRYHVATKEGITTAEVIRLIDNVIDAS